MRDESQLIFRLRYVDIMSSSVASTVQMEKFSFPSATNDTRDRSNTESTTKTTRSESVASVDSIPPLGYSRFHLPPVSISKKKEEKQPLLRPDIKILCMDCEEEISVRKMREHREWHGALKTFRYTIDNKPSSIKQLIKRRRALMKRLNETADSDNPVSIKALHKMNLSYEIIKADIEGTKTTLRQIDEIYQPDILGTSDRLTCALALGVCKDQNSRWRLSMEDRYSFKDCFCNDPQSGYFGIFDGYSGSVAAEKCASKFHQILEKKVEKIYQEEIKHGDVNSEIINAFKEAYFEMDEVLLFGEDEWSRNRWSGCSAVTCLLRGKNLYVANAGNIRAVLCRGDGSIVRVSHDQSPKNKKERHRVRKANGEVCRSEKSILVNGVVTSTRGLGNHGDPRLKSSVINQPAVNCLSLIDSDQFLLLASNGVWEVFNEEEMVLLLEEIIPDIDLKAVVQKIRMQMNGEINTETQESSSDTSCENKTQKASQVSCFQQNAVPVQHADEKAESKSYDKINDKSKEKVTMSHLGEPDDNSIKKHPTGLDITHQSDRSLLSVFHSGSETDLSTSTLNLAHPKSSSQLVREEKAVELAKALSERLVEAALLAGSRDNATAMVVLLKGCPVQMFLLPSVKR